MKLTSEERYAIKFIESDEFNINVNNCSDLQTIINAIKSSPEYQILSKCNDINFLFERFNWYLEDIDSDKHGELSDIALCTYILLLYEIGYHEEILELQHSIFATQYFWTNKLIIHLMHL